MILSYPSWCFIGRKRHHCSWRFYRGCEI